MFSQVFLVNFLLTFLKSYTFHHSEVAFFHMSSKILAFFHFFALVTFDLYELAFFDVCLVLFVDSFDPTIFKGWAENRLILATILFMGVYLIMGEKVLATTLLIYAFEFQLVKKVTCYSMSPLSKKLFATVRTNFVVSFPFCYTGFTKCFLALGAFFRFIQNLLT